MSASGWRPSTKRRSGPTWPASGSRPGRRPAAMARTARARRSTCAIRKATGSNWRG